MLAASFLLALASPAAQLPFTKYTDPDWPQGVDLGHAVGVSFGDYDGDGWADLFVCNDGRLWRNLSGQGWVEAFDLGAMLPASAQRYGAAFGDYDRDGFPDIATEPRKYGLDDCLHIFHNLGGVAWVDIAADANLLDAQPCSALAETAGWADFDGDGDLDLFLPTYGAVDGSVDNQYLHNLGPTGPAGAFRFSEKAASVGVKIPPGAARPEGVVTMDIDGDGALDLYSNGHWYRNLSTFDFPLFENLASKSSGVKKRTIVDEGTVAIDYDLDGDLDLLISYTFNRGNRLWINRGDGTYSEAPESVVEDYVSGSAYGISAADWDNDGDIDITTNDVFRTNRMMESDTAEWHIVASSHVPEVGAPAWADWDLDGDLDLAVGDGPGVSFLYRNDLYGPQTPLADKRYVRVRVVDDAPGLLRGVETEYGAIVELKMHNAALGKRFVQLVSSSAGYINQNEYSLHFGLPADPVPGDPSRDLRFDVVVDLPSLPELGYRRIDKRVNPALANLDLALLDQREITIFRSGKVLLGDREYVPVDPGETALQTTTGGLLQQLRNEALVDLTPATGSDEYVGIELDTIGAPGPQRVVEVLLDGQPGAVVDCGFQNQEGNVAVWDVTLPGSPRFVGAVTAILPAGNRRAATPTEIVLEPGRIFRMVARVDSYRVTSVSTPWIGDGVSVNGGLHFIDTSPCSGSAVEQASLENGQVYLAVRLRANDGPRWFDLGQSQGGGGRTPFLKANGIARVGEDVELRVTGLVPGERVRLISGARLSAFHAQGLVVSPDGTERVQGQADAQGEFVYNVIWPSTHVPGRPVYVQAVVGEASSTLRASNLIGTIGEAR
ncbi:MAG: VCBS repeat-containing protein [Planctomycetes bacterium]|nr:VCBS repeat-containing protein [Planctomycetota bacterium]